MSEKEDDLAKEIEHYLSNNSNISLSIGMLVYLKAELTNPLPRRLYKITEVNTLYLIIFRLYLTDSDAKRFV